MLAQLSSGDISLMFGVSLPLLAFDSHELVDMFYILNVSEKLPVNHIHLT